MEIGRIFDSHAHYYDSRFEKEHEGGAVAILREIMPCPVRTIVNVGTYCENSRLAIRQAAEHPGMFAAAGIHPEDCHALSDEDAAFAELRAILGTREERKAAKIVALGEIGLDYHSDCFGPYPLDRAKERRFFDAQLDMAEELDLPVIIHDRDAHGDCFETILRHPGNRGVFHSFSSSPEMARELLRRGWYLSFSGTLTFKNAARVREAALVVPRDRLLIETDAPYLAPHPLRGSLNHSGLLTYTLTVLADLWHCTPEEAAQQTSKNAETLFQIAKFV